MTPRESRPFINVYEGPQFKLENQYIDEYLKDQGYTWAEVALLPEAEAKRLMIAACSYASARLAKLEAQAKFRKKIRID